MAFNSNDLYTVSGGIDIFNYWNPFVTKHDSSSFYNWEQDNLPSYDLEERTFYLWERFGYHLSAVPSMALVVSSSVPTHLVLSANVFTSVSAAVEALPEIIRMPTLIEVAVSGDMGELNLNNIKCEEDGALEIINRGFAPMLEWVNVNSDVKTNTTVLVEDSWDPNHGIPNQLSGAGPVNFLTNASALSVSANTADLFPANGTAGFYRNLSYAALSTSGGVVPYKTGYGVVGGSKAGGQTFRSSNIVYVSPLVPTSYAPTHQYDDETILSDVSSTAGDRSRPGQGQLVNGIITANKFSKIKLQNCDGPIYIRGFIADGYNDTSDTFDTDIGIGVYNSAGVVLEDCGAMRCTSAGYELVNSKVELARRNLSMRNYDTTNRFDWGLDGKQNITYGIKASNSELTYSPSKGDSSLSAAKGICGGLASYFNTYGIHLTNSTLKGGDKMSGAMALGKLKYKTSVELGYNDVGLYATNSEYSLNGITDVYNNETNIKAIGSDIRTEVFNNEYGAKEGIVLENSKFILNKNLSQQVGALGLSLYNVANTVYGSYPFVHNTNFRHLVLTEGSYYGFDFPADFSSLSFDKPGGDRIFSKNIFNTSFGTDYAGTYVPSIQINNSYAVLSSPFIINDDSMTASRAIKGTAIQVNDGGVCKLIGNGSDGCMTSIFGPTSFSTQQKLAGVAALNGSKIYIHGPTEIIQYGVDLLAENNSIIKVCPILDNTNSHYDISGYGQLGTQTTLELHSTRACAVANNNSKLVFEDLGMFEYSWPSSESDTADYTVPQSVSGIIASGSLQFYPNPQLNSMAHSDLIRNASIDLPTLNAPFSGDDFKRKKDQSIGVFRLMCKEDYGLADRAQYIRDNLSRGGVCVKATGNSEVVVRNVHFPTAYVNSDQSYFDPSASIAGCNDLFIWNIQDSSKLNASYSTVSGVYPSLNGYTGPRSFYTASGTELGLGDDSSAVGYTAFSGTPDTRTLSVLDHFGSGVDIASTLTNLMPNIQLARTGNASTYGEPSYKNRGPFRLFFSVHPGAKALSYATSDNGAVPEDTRPYQHLAQGYALSGAVSADMEVSGIYPELLTVLNDTSTFATSGYYYPTDVVLDASDLPVFGMTVSGRGYATKGLMQPTNEVNVWLDESFADTFDNARHCSTDYSGRKRLVNIYKAKVTTNGEGFMPSSPSVSGYGMGFRSTNIFDLDRDL